MGVVITQDEQDDMKMHTIIKAENFVKSPRETRYTFLAQLFVLRIFFKTPSALFICSIMPYSYRGVVEVALAPRHQIRGFEAALASGVAAAARAQLAGQPHVREVGELEARRVELGLVSS